MELRLHTGPSPYFDIPCLEHLTMRLLDRNGCGYVSIGTSGPNTNTWEQYDAARTKASYFLQELSRDVNTRVQSFLERK